VSLVIDVRQPAAHGEVLAVGELEIRPDDRLALAAGRTLPLSSRELTLLTALARSEGRIVSREDLYASVWGAPLRATDRSVDVYVHKLRSKLADALPGWRFIHTHFGFGYRLAPEPLAAQRPRQRTTKRERIR
jgi:DNA-binding response OmpR family regulator